MIPADVYRAILTVAVYRAGVGFANARITLPDNSSSGDERANEGTSERANERAKRRLHRWAFSRRDRRGGEEDTGETERDENVWRKTSIHGGVRGRALSTLPTYQPTYRMRAFGPASDLRGGLSKGRPRFRFINM